VEWPKKLIRYDMLKMLYSGVEKTEALKTQYKYELHNGTAYDDAILDQFDLISGAIKELMLMIDPTIFDDGEERRCTS